MTKQKIESFEIITLHTSGMRYSADYEIVMKGDAAEVSQYQIRHRYPENERILEKRVSVSNDTMLTLLNNCKLLSWDGFHGKHPRGVLDGTMFSLNAVVNGGIKIRADGSQNFPKHYRDFTDGLYEMLSGNNGMHEIFVKTNQ